MKIRKTVLLLASIFLMGMTGIYAQQNQKIAYVDSNYILENIPEYADAQEEINQLSKQWEKEITALFQEAQELDREYQAESVLLSEDQKRKKKEAITAKRQEAENLRMQYYGPEGELYTKRAELIQPIQEKVYNAINTLAQLKNYAFIFDKETTEELITMFKEDQEDSTLLTAEIYKKRSLWKKFVGWFAHLLTPFL